MGYGVRDLTPRQDRNDRQRLANFLANASRYATLLIRRAASDLPSYDGYWAAALESGTELRALGAVERNVTMVYGEDNEAITALANELARRVLSRPARGTWPFFGDRDMMDTFWQTYRKVGKARRVVSDRIRLLCGTKEPAEPLKPNLEVRLATTDDLKVVFAFTGDQAVEQWGADPRRLSPRSHEAACRAAIAEGRQVVGRDRGRPVFVAELAPFDDEACLIDRLHVPRPFRVRKKMVASAMAMTGALACAERGEALFFIDADDAQLVASAEMAGFEVRRKYRFMILRS